MLRTAFVLLIVAFGVRHALRGPFYALMFYLWIAYFRPQEWVWGGVVQDLNISFYAALLVVLLAVFTGQAFRFSGRGMLFALFVAHSLISTLDSPYSQYGWPYWVDFLKSTLMAYLLCVLVDSVSRLRLAFLVIALSLGFEASKSSWGQLIFSPGTKNWNEIGMLGDNNGVAVGMFMLVPLLIALIQTTKSKWARYGLLWMLFGIIYRGISTYSRGGLIACVVMALMYIFRSKHKVRTLIAVGATAGIIAPLLSQAYWERVSSIRLPGVIEDISQETTADEASAAGRLHFWKVATLMTKDRPFLGVGHNSFVPAYDAYDDMNGAYGHRKSAHSSWFGVLAELGIVGFLIFVTIFVFGLLTSTRILRLARGDPHFSDLTPYAIALQVGLIVFAVGGAFVVLQYNEMLWHFLGLSAALSRIAQARLRARQDAPSSGLVVLGQLSPQQGVA